MQKKSKLSVVERLEIGILKAKGHSCRSIARVMERSPNTIAYEIKENSVLGIYDPHKAQQKALVDRKYHKFQWSKVEHNKELRAYVIQKLEAHWNPDEIAGRMRNDHEQFYVSKTAIYDWLHAAWGQQYCPLLYSGRYRKKKHPISKRGRTMIAHRVSIDKRPIGANNRSRYGHHEADAIVSCRGGTGAIAVDQERKSRLIGAQQIPTLSPKVYTAAMRRIIAPCKVRSITLDNGQENRGHEQLGVPTFFCDPYSSWQKGGVENGNKMIRRYIPKGTNLATITQAYLDQIIAIINNKPRKILNYRTALEVACAGGVLLPTITSMS